MKKGGGDIIQGRTLYKGGHYLRKYGIYPEYVDKLDSKSILEEFIRHKGHGKLFGKSESSGPLKTLMPELP